MIISATNNAKSGPPLNLEPAVFRLWCETEDASPNQPTSWNLRSKIMSKVPFLGQVWQITSSSQSKGRRSPFKERANLMGNWTFYDDHGKLGWFHRLL